MKKQRTWIPLFCGILLCFAANSGALLYRHPAATAGVIAFTLLSNLLPVFAGSGILRTRLRFLIHGNTCLILFLTGALISIPCQLALAVIYLFREPMVWLISVLVCIGVLALIFWNGIISIYCTSWQLGLKKRIIGALCGMIPVVNLIVLLGMLKVVNEEIRFETEKALRNHHRKQNRVCATRYPILLVHGVFFRDNRHFNYWGRIPDELIQNGAKIYYGDQPSAASIADCASFLTERIRRIVSETGCEKVNIIAHSKGGLDSRYAIAFCGAAPYVASLTTINTPHRGCKFADYLLEKIPLDAQQAVAATYNKALGKLGEADADFMAAVRDLTSGHCAALDQTMPLPEGIYGRSIGSKLNKAPGGKFPLNFTYHLVHHFDGGNDGLVGEESFQWGQDYLFLQTGAVQGISHGDMIDLNRTNLPCFDVREFYVQLVADLKQKGL